MNAIPLNPNTAAGKICLLARAANCTPSFMARRILESKYSEFKTVVNSYREWLALCRIAKQSHRFYNALWIMWSGQFSAPIAGLKGV